jgi:fermentation-respiration switch protein FrsA (DUF1100 family)
MLNIIKMMFVGLSISTSPLDSISANFLGLVYKGAITENIKGKVNIHSVTYVLKGINISANVYTPVVYDPSKKFPAVVIAHPNGGVKEQVSGLYAQHLAEKSFITIVADASYQGASGGEPRNTDKPANRIEDIYGMADYILKYPGVDTDRIGLLGICGGGGYALKAAQGDKRFKSIATLSMFNTGRVRRNGFLDRDMATIQERLEKASKARQREILNGEVSYLGTANPSDEEIEKISTDLYREGYTYYYRTHTHPNSTFRYTENSLIDLMTFDANTNTDLIRQPLLMIAGSNADTKYMSDEVFHNAVNAKPREYYVVDGATHIDTYWKEEYVNQVINKLVRFYNNTLI